MLGNVLMPHKRPPLTDGIMLHDGNRLVQDAFDSRCISDRLETSVLFLGSRHHPHAAVAGSARSAIRARYELGCFDGSLTAA
jgi:hypothetical protein